jgi:hypothetical protein
MISALLIFLFLNFNFPQKSFSFYLGAYKHDELEDKKVFQHRPLEKEAHMQDAAGNGITLNKHSRHIGVRRIFQHFLWDRTELGLR